MIEKRTIKKTIPINITEDVYVVKDIKGHEHSINDINTAQAMSSIVEKYDKLKKYIAKIFEDKYLKDIKQGDLVIISGNKYDLKTKSFIPNTNSVVTIGYYKPSQQEYFNIVTELAKKYPEITMSDDELRLEANRWELSHGGISGRTAQQFINHIAGISGTEE